MREGDAVDVASPGPSYCPPAVEVLGSVVDLTEHVGTKSFNASDGATMFGVPEGYTS